MRRMLAARFFRDRSKAIYQPFVPPEEVDGHARLIRLHLLLSPIGSRYLSAHGVLARTPLPEHLPEGLVADSRPFLVNFSRDSKYCRLAPQIEAELETVAMEFIALAKPEIAARFLIRPES